MANSLSVPCSIIPNPYQSAVFDGARHAGSKRDLVFLGRLIEGKGLGVLLHALALLADRGIRPTLTVIGRGPAEDLHRQQVTQLALAAQVEFSGPLRGVALRDRLTEHQLLIVPSVWDEPFGIVVLEGLACGLIPVVADAGGLPEAVGQCGPIVSRNKPSELAGEIERLLRDDTYRHKFRDGTAEYLVAHKPSRIAERYLQSLKKQNKTSRS
jgi:glycosyltransferase involved in cell wall biosynthesis